MTQRDSLLVFAARALMVNKDLDAVETRLDLDLGRPETRQAEQDPAYYLQFAALTRHEAALMSRHYETLYCLENSIRDLVASQMLSFHAVPDWWDRHVPDAVKQNVDANRRRESDAGVSPRSIDLLDYTTFGELSTIVIYNWAAFSDTFNSKKAVERVFAGLNMLRGPIAHCSTLAPDEVTRLELAIKDYYRLME